MKKLLLISMFLGATSALSSAGAASTLLSNLPSGALATFETSHMSAAINRASGLLKNVMKTIGGKNAELSDVGDMLSSFTPILKGTLGNEGVLGVFAVTGKKGVFDPGLLAVTRVNDETRGLLKSMMPTAKKPARVGKYTFVRSDDMFVGMSQDLAYVSSDKNLLMSYLGRLSGKAAPRLEQAPAYATPMNAVGAQELRAYFNFSAIAKVVRSQFATIGFPRLVAPVIDAIDTLGQVGAGISTNAAGLSGTSALMANAGSPDKTLYSILTHSTAAFNVQSILPADAEALSVNACDPLTAEYTARWITRLDLFDPTGFLSDTQLAHNLEQQGRYLGDECAQVMLKGGTRASLTASSNPLQALNYTVFYQKVTDEDAARAQMQDFAPSVNKAIQAAVKTTKTQLGTLLGDVSGAAETAEMQSLLNALKLDQFKSLNYVYDFKDGYLVTAFSQKALDSAMNATAFVADAPDFQTQNFTLSGGGFGFQRAARTPYTKQDIAKLLQGQLGRTPLGVLIFGLNPLAGSDATVRDPEAQQLIQSAAVALANLLNRYGGSSAHTSVTNNLVVTTSSIKYKW